MFSFTRDNGSRVTVQPSRFGGGAHEITNGSGGLLSTREIAGMSDADANRLGAAAHLATERRSS